MFNLKNVDYYCICMDNDNGNSKWDRVVEIFKNQNIKITRFYGINGKELIVPKICPYTNTMVGLNNAEYGCYLSHIEIIKDSMLRDLDYVLIFEDDVMLCDDFKKRLDYLVNCNIDFDMFYFGGSFNHHTINHKETKDKYIHKYLGAAGLHAYIVSKKIYKYILDNIRFDRAIDGFYATVIGEQYDDRLENKLFFDIKGFMPQSAGCYGNFSELSNRYTTNSDMNVNFQKQKI